MIVVAEGVGAIVAAAEMTGVVVVAAGEAGSFWQIQGMQTAQIEAEGVAGTGVGTVLTATAGMVVTACVGGRPTRTCTPTTVAGAAAQALLLLVLLGSPGVGAEMPRHRQEQLWGCLGGLETNASGRHEQQEGLLLMGGTGGVMKGMVGVGMCQQTAGVDSSTLQGAAAGVVGAGRLMVVVPHRKAAAGHAALLKGLAGTEIVLLVVAAVVVAVRQMQHTTTPAAAAGSAAEAAAASSSTIAAAVVAAA